MKETAVKEILNEAERKYGIVQDENLEFFVKLATYSLLEEEKFDFDEEGSLLGYFGTENDFRESIKYFNYIKEEIFKQSIEVSANAILQLMCVTEGITTLPLIFGHLLSMEDNLKFSIIMQKALELTEQIQ